MEASNIPFLRFTEQARINRILDELGKKPNSEAVYEGFEWKGGQRPGEQPRERSSLTV